MHCPICQAVINDIAIFCPSCGKKVPRCPTCNKVIYNKVSFCTKDGTALPEELVADLPPVVNRGMPGIPMQGQQHVTPPEGNRNPSVVYTPPQMRQRFCNRCGNPCAPTQTLCDRCMHSPMPQEKPSKRSSKKPIVILILCFVLLALLVGLLYFYVLRGSEEDKRPHRETETSESTEAEMQTERTQEVTETEPETELITEAPETEAPTYSEEETQTETEEETELERIDDPVEYFILNSDKQYFTKEFFENFTEQECMIARNGVYARLGRKFNSDFLRGYFSTFDWYDPHIEPQDFTESMLNVYQKANIDLLVAFEQEMGYW